MTKPRREINWNLVEKKIEAGCTAKEIYENFCNRDTFYDRFREEYGMSFSDYSAEAYSVGNGNIKFTQYVKALGGNIPMLQLLGRERLGQGKNEESNSPLQNQIDQSHLIMQLQYRISELEKNIGKPINSDKPQTE